MKMFLTRMGTNSKVIVTGDPTQTDLPRSVRSGLADAVQRLKDVDGLAIVYLDQTDIVRNPLVTRIVKAYEDETKGAQGHRVKTVRGEERVRKKAGPSLLTPPLLTPHRFYFAGMSTVSITWITPLLGRDAGRTFAVADRQHLPWTATLNFARTASRPPCRSARPTSPASPPPSPRGSAAPSFSNSLSPLHLLQRRLVQLLERRVGRGEHGVSPLPLSASVSPASFTSPASTV
jgi:hypothetical protein